MTVAREKTRKAKPGRRPSARTRRRLALLYAASILNQLDAGDVGEHADILDEIMPEMQTLALAMRRRAGVDEFPMTWRECVEAVIADAATKGGPA